MTDLTCVCADGKTPAAESDFDLEGDSQGQAAAEFLAGAAQTAGAEETADDSSSTSSSSSSSHNNESGSSSSRSTSPASAPTTAGEDQPQQQPQQPQPQLRQQPLQPQPQPQPQPAAASQQPTANVENPSTALSLPTFRCCLSKCWASACCVVEQSPSALEALQVPAGAKLQVWLKYLACLCETVRDYTAGNGRSIHALTTCSHMVFMPFLSVSCLTLRAERPDPSCLVGSGC